MRGSGAGTHIYVAEAKTAAEWAAIVAGPPELSTMAPLDFLNATPHVKPFHLFWTAADADVSGTPFLGGGELLPFQLIDRARGHKQSVYIHGGAHGWFHEDCGVPEDDDPDCWPFQRDPIATTETDVHSIVRRYYVPLLAKYLEGNIPAQDYFWRWPSFEPLPEAVARSTSWGSIPTASCSTTSS